LSESINPWVYSLQFLFKSTNNSWRYERKCEWVFFSEHSVLPYSYPVTWQNNYGSYFVTVVILSRYTGAINSSNHTSCNEAVYIRCWAPFWF